MSSELGTALLRDSAELSAARPIRAHEQVYVRGLSSAIEAGRLPNLALLSMLAGAVRDGTDRALALEASRSLGQITRAVVLFYAARKEQVDFDRFHDAIRMLAEPALDAWQDLLSEVAPHSLKIVEAERLWRAGALSRDWRIRLSDAGDVLLVDLHFAHSPVDA
jgi:hypothetical protein